MTAGGQHVVLVGLMGSGKTTVGRLVAHRLGRPLVDTDETIEATTGRTVREIWKADGEAAFRVLERDVVAAALEADQPSVIAAAGGVVLAAANREMLQRSDAVVVWLSADPDVLAAVRAASGDHRPLLDDDPVAALRAMATDRAEWYRSVADHVLAVADRDPEQIVLEVAGLVAADG